MGYVVSLTAVSMNKKTGPIPVSTSSSNTCPVDCGMRAECYGKFGPLKIHWDLIDKGKRGVDWDTFCDQITRLYKGQIWRHNQAGDLPGDGEQIDAAALGALIRANKGKQGFTYTHYSVADEHNRYCIEEANTGGFTINVSCDSLDMCDSARVLTDAPLAVVLPSTETRKSLSTPSGHRVVVCPASYSDGATCATCRLCAIADSSRPIIGFPAHGTRKKSVDKRLEKENQDV